MIILDYILIGVILIFAIWGFKQGFLQVVGSMVGLVVAVVLAGKYYLLLGSFLGGNNLSNFFAFLLIFSLILKIMSLLFWGFGKVFEIIAIIPFLKTFERLLGSVLGIVQGILVLSVVIYFLSKYPLNDWLISQMADSLITPLLLMISYIFLPLLPEALKALKSIL
ncbi:hypothetical protein A2533_04125 [Candidatus Falkowbacteria bacterium RIFOXYD2_FULL_35_9]|uniref:Colicin V production protein n=1 Tax=Candidatus Falkowbacteria bacterium RIFOXYC2_FULL_36_12 TaxID=1798002 RepID=A0A1F5SYT3_9BACT|nr:MAG: hypothetical protein A2478_04120 [Candidatus Falkowbacteria bacterium RIFOXYC2_FULL_36_12]OGF46713.1 MAG: hypothetical protein A2533_04125 [Candidatus Falkowbacteria bacterium RIFOXYD2_FULL_35_9]